MYIKRYMERIPLKSRLAILFLFLLMIILGSYYYVITNYATEFMEGQLQASYEESLSQNVKDMDELIWNLTLTSQQLMDSELLIPSLQAMNSAERGYFLRDIDHSIRDEIYRLTLPNADLGLIYFYSCSNDSLLFSTFPPDRKVTSLSSAPCLYQVNNFTCYGPCRSQSNLFGNPVLILNRRFVLDDGEEWLLSLESGLYSLENLFALSENKNACLLFLDESGNVVYNNFSDSLDAQYSPEELLRQFGNSYHIFSEKSSHSWSLYALVPNDVYRIDYLNMMKSLSVCTVVITLALISAAIVLWRSIFHPLQVFDRQLGSLLSDDVTEPGVHVGIPEYEYLLKKIAVMKKQISEMIERLLFQEKQRSTMQLEKLRAQINPHFLMNTLNTVHWMSLMRGETEIDHIIQSLSHLLSYNLDKENYAACLERELDAARNYVALQKVRYNFTFTESISPPGQKLNYPCPKFILQPLIENALYHGYRENMSISLSIIIDALTIVISVQDNGTGMSEERLAQLRSLTGRVPGSAEDSGGPAAVPGSFGIGLPYVVQSLDDFTHGQYQFLIDSAQEAGTVITLVMSKKRGEQDAEGSDRR